jgi:hypothetical protein
MITFFKNLLFTLRFHNAKLLINEECGEVREINGVYYAVLTNGLVYEIKHFSKFFKVRVFHNGVDIYDFKWYSEIQKKDEINPLEPFENFQIKSRIKTTLDQILSETPFTLCKPEAFLTLAASMKTHFNSDDLLTFLFEKQYSSIGMVDYKLGLRNLSDNSYIPDRITIIDGVIYNPTSERKLPVSTFKNLAILDKYSDTLNAFFLHKDISFFVAYFDLEYMHLVHFLDPTTMEKTSINYKTGVKTVSVEKSSTHNIHEYLESIMYELIRIKPSNDFFDVCEQHEISIQDPMIISKDEIELFKMAIY